MLGIRMNSRLRALIKRLAAAEGRTESGFVRYHLANLVRNHNPDKP